MRLLWHGNCIMVKRHFYIDVVLTLFICIEAATNRSLRPGSNLNGSYIVSIEYRNAGLIKLIEAEWRIYASVNFPSFVQIMACRLIGAKPLSEQMKSWSKFVHFHLRKFIWICRQETGGYFVSAQCFALIKDDLVLRSTCSPSPCRHRRCDICMSNTCVYYMGGTLCPVRYKSIPRKMQALNASAATTLAAIILI